MTIDPTSHPLSVPRWKKGPAVAALPWARQRCASPVSTQTLRDMGCTVTDEGDLKPLPARDVAAPSEGANNLQLSAPSRANSAAAVYEVAAAENFRSSSAATTACPWAAFPAWHVMQPMSDARFSCSGSMHIRISTHRRRRRPGNIHGMPVAFFCG